MRGKEGEEEGREKEGREEEGERRRERQSVGSVKGINRGAAHPSQSLGLSPGLLREEDTNEVELSEQAADREVVNCGRGRFGGVDKERLVPGTGRVVENLTATSAPNLEESARRVKKLLFTKMGAVRKRMHEERRWGEMEGARRREGEAHVVSGSSWWNILPDTTLTRSLSRVIIVAPYLARSEREKWSNIAQVGR